MDTRAQNTSNHHGLRKRFLSRQPHCALQAIQGPSSRVYPAALGGNPWQRPDAPRWRLLRPGDSSIRATNFFRPNPCGKLGGERKSDVGEGRSVWTGTSGPTWVSAPFLSGCCVSGPLCQLVALLFFVFIIWCLPPVRTVVATSTL